ncbi:MAG: antibiotic biosynthesis monooxygenase [Gammaproteobacteria bacterium SG8_11]|nr:MAG: antibiotic biosynthesis monooxygenase [Gammaproteobacteria bacterium SG8_11]
MSKIILKGHIVVPAEDLEAVKAALPLHIELTQQEAGCLIFDVTQDETQKNIFNVYEEFIGRSSFEAHQDRVRTSSWGEVTKNVERHYQIKED